MATNPSDFGTGLDVYRSWPLRFTFTSGFRNLGNNLARRLSTIRGSLPWDLDCGYPLVQLLRGSLSDDELSAAESSIGAECEKDERVDSASAKVTYVRAAGVLIVTITGTGADGPFTLILSADALTVAILRFSQGDTQ